ncbi:PAC2 family protein [Zhihengliuella sp.]|uniref:PAC2 family protein n=1 Tax=Zhihengliuella sp. TaxID=1954483 RepID=UPI0028124852|nr:PAC2 family protein [Zhihengliuella sp.]
MLTELGTPSEVSGAEPAPGKRPAVMLVAFEGWNDAGSAASDAVALLERELEAESIATIGDDDYYDYQFSRPSVRRTSAGQRFIQWPTTRFLRAARPDRSHDLLLVRGVEPTYRWKAFCAELLTLAEAQNVQAVVLTGALLADSPHTRPVPLSVTSDDATVREGLGAESPGYEGPTGIVGVLAAVAEAAGLPTVSVWAAVPHYVAQSPSPKATYALLRRLEDLLEIEVDLHLLGEDAEAWERGVDELAGEDPEIAAYVKQLEEAQDAAELPEASGESIAREFERYLKRRDDGSGDGGRPPRS